MTNKRFTKLPPSIVEQRRLASVKAMKKVKRERFLTRYQQQCDAFYWKHGRCCAGCDHWTSDGGWIGSCMAAPPVSGVDIIKSLGIDWSSYIPPPGQPFTRHNHVCGAFSDQFDWTTLEPEYLRAIGATADFTPTSNNDSN